MKFETPLVPGRLLRRYKRFLADVELHDGEVVTAYCANPGSMMGLMEAGAEVWLSPAASPTRKLRYSWELLRVGEGLVGINTAHPNVIVAEAIAGGQVPELAGYDALTREVRYGRNSRIDILLEGVGGQRCYVEVKNVHLQRDGGTAEFPDSVTKRGAKHLDELADMVAEGHRALMFYLIQREDCRQFAIASDIDPAYDAAFRRGLAAGVEAVAYACRLTTAGIELDRRLPILTGNGRPIG